MNKKRQLKVKKFFGQHFLMDELLTASIAQSAVFKKDARNLLEIGPGPGILTKFFLEDHTIRFKAVEADRDMIAYLSDQYPDHVHQFILKDCLKLDFNTLFDGAEFTVIGNFPYNISSQIVFKILDNLSKVPYMIGMFQKEMADRIVAPHGSKTYGVISILTQAYFDCETLYFVPPTAFKPPPKVDSSVIKLTRRQETIKCDPKLFRQVVKISFSQRRKMLRNTLKSMINDEQILKDSYFNNRPEHLSVQEFIDLTNLIAKHKK